MRENAEFVRRLGLAAADVFGYPAPSPAWAESAASRLTDDVLDAVRRGMQQGHVVDAGATFRLAALGEAKGPYSWFSRSPSAVPAPNWEYFVQVGTWMSVKEVASADCVVGFEDELMDVTVRRSGELLWCVEVKEKAVQLDQMLTQLALHAKGVDAEAPDRGNDPLRKAKYLVRARPRFFSLVAVGRWDDFAVDFPDGAAFRLTPTTRSDVLGGLAG